MSLADRILGSLSSTPVAAPAVYERFNSESLEALDAALQSLLNRGRVLRYLGEYWLPQGERRESSPAKKVSQSPRRKERPGLTEKQRLACELHSAGKPLDAIAIALGLSRRTVSVHLTNARRKLGLRGSPGRPRSERFGLGRDAPGAPLTVREVEIADLAASGRTARQIATHCGVSAKTVAGHLTRIYAKLEIYGKDELAEALLKREGAP